MTFSHAPEALNTQSDELTELYSKQLSAIENLGIKIPPLWAAKYRRCGILPCRGTYRSAREDSLLPGLYAKDSLLPGLYATRRRDPQLWHNANDSPETIRKINVLVQSKEGFEADLPDSQNSLTFYIMWSLKWPRLLNWVCSPHRPRRRPAQCRALCPVPQRRIVNGASTVKVAVSIAGFRQFLHQSPAQALRRRRRAGGARRPSGPSRCCWIPTLPSSAFTAAATAEAGLCSSLALCRRL